jgi:hypothetical protein
VLYDPWIETFLGHKLVNLEDFRTKQRFFLHLFKDYQPKGYFVLSLAIEVVGYLAIIFK